MRTPPRGWGRLAWVGPGFLWMVSAAGSGELLFTPRVGALYGYALLWAVFAAVALKWFINREVGRFTVVTGATIIDGFRRLPGPRNWALWIILVPQAFVAVTTIAGLAASAATALVLVLPGDVRIWTIAAIAAASAIVFVGRYRWVELVAIVIAVALAVAAVAAAIGVLPDPAELAGGLAPRVPADVEMGEILPWIGFMLSGAAGMIWYSYWLRSKGYGAASGGRGAAAGSAEERPPIERGVPAGDEDRRRLRGWLVQLAVDNSVAVFGTLVITIAFLVLGAELLRPHGLVPEENRVAETLGRLLGDVFGPVGFWFMIAAVFVGFWDTVLSDQDGFGRMFSEGIRFLARQAGIGFSWSDLVVRRIVLVGLLTVLPIAVYLVIGEPVRALQIAGAIEAGHIPVLAALTLYLNHRALPPGLRASWPAVAVTALAALFFAGFAIAFVVTILPG